MGYAPERQREGGGDGRGHVTFRVAHSQTLECPDPCPNPKRNQHSTRRSAPQPPFANAVLCDRRSPSSSGRASAASPIGSQTRSTSHISRSRTSPGPPSRDTPAASPSAPSPARRLPSCRRASTPTRDTLPGTSSTPRSGRHPHRSCPRPPRSHQRSHQFHRNSPARRTK